MAARSSRRTLRKADTAPRVEPPRPGTVAGSARKGSRRSARFFGYAEVKGDGTIAQRDIGTKPLGFCPVLSRQTALRQGHSGTFCHFVPPCPDVARAKSSKNLVMDACSDVCVEHPCAFSQRVDTLVPHSRHVFCPACGLVSQISFTPSTSRIAITLRSFELFTARLKAFLRV